MTMPAHVVYILNSLVLTSYGEWVFEGPIDVEQARTLLRDGFISAIGHQGTADFLSVLLDLTIPTNRVWVEMQPGDRALVVRILERMPEGKMLTSEEMKRIPYELGIMTRRR